MTALVLLPWQDLDAFRGILDQTENWLYEDGEDEAKNVYVEKLAKLKVQQPFINPSFCCFRNMSEF